jgi:hypothetical protein
MISLFVGIFILAEESKGIVFLFPLMRKRMSSYGFYYGINT